MRLKKRSHLFFNLYQWNAGLAHVDIYLFPCYSCGNPAGQVGIFLHWIISKPRGFLITRLRRIKWGQVR